MSRPSRSRKRKEYLSELPIVSLKKGAKGKRFDPAKRLANPNFVAAAFFQALRDNDVETALDAIEGYLLASGKSDIAKSGNLPSSTVYYAVSKGANPTLRTLANLIHAADQVGS